VELSFVLVSPPTKLLVSLSVSLPQLYVDKTTACGIHLPGRPRGGPARATRRKSRYDLPPSVAPWGPEEALSSPTRGVDVPPPSPPPPGTTNHADTMPRADNVSCETTVSTKFTLPASLDACAALHCTRIDPIASARGLVSGATPTCDSCAHSEPSLGATLMRSLLSSSIEGAEHRHHRQGPGMERTDDERRADIDRPGWSASEHQAHRPTGNAWRLVLPRAARMS
jgi:hypothetical protein